MNAMPPPPGVRGPAPPGPAPDTKRKGGAFARGFKGCLGIGSAVVLALAVITVIIVIASGGTKNSGQKDTGGSPSGSPQTFAVGDAIRVGGDLVLRVTGVTSSPGNEVEHPQHGQFLIVAVSFENQSSQPVAISSALSFDLRDSSGQGFTETIFTAAPKPPDGEIAPHDKLAGALAYDVSHGHYTLHFKNDLLATGQVIVDLGNR